MNDFYPRFTVLKDGKTELPFTAGGVTQKGPHSGEDQNNQDAMSLLVRENAVAAVVCDGCTGASYEGQNTFSFNEFAAQALSVLALNHIASLIYNNTNTNPESIASWLDRSLCKDLSYMLSLMHGKNDYLKIHDHLVIEMFASTVSAAVILKNKWFVLHCGDGVVIENGVLRNMESDAGIYLANKLHSKNTDKPRMFKLLCSGDTSRLNSLLIGTDGVIDFVEKDNDAFALFQSKLEERNEPYQRGYDAHFCREFRKRFYYPWRGGERGGHDDRSFILVRRIPQGGNDEQD